LNRLPSIALVTVVLTNALLGQQQASIKPASVYHLGGVTIVSPNQPGWVLLQSNESLVAFQREVEGEVVNASVKLIKTKVFDRRRFEPAVLAVLKVKHCPSLIYSIRFLSKLPGFSAALRHCVQYDGIFTGDASAPKFKYFNFRGYLCRSPGSKDMVVQIEFSNHSNRRAFSENLVSRSDEFFEKIAFSKVAGP